MRVFRRLWTFLNPRAADREMERELASHLKLMEDEFERRGQDRECARNEARRAMGGLDQTRELHRDSRSFVWLEQVRQDIRHALRALVRNPGFTLVSVLTLTLAIGVNTTLFSAYNAIALKPLPVGDPQRVVRVKRWFQNGGRGDAQFAFSHAEYLYCRSHGSSLSGLVAASWPIEVRSDGAKRRFGQLVSDDYFTVLGIDMRAGRGLSDDETQTPVVVLSHAFWKSQFAQDPSAVGRTLMLNGTQFEIVGVAPEQFTGTSIVPPAPDFWTPLVNQKLLVPSADWVRSPADARFQLLGRLGPRVRRDAAQAEVDTLIRQFDEPLLLEEKTASVTLQPTALLAEADDVRFQAVVAGLGLLVGLVLLVACANIANMLLARGAARRREIAARLMLGASRGRVVRHLFTESLLLALAGGAGGVVLSLWASRLLWIKVSESLARTSGGAALLPMNLAPDPRVIGYAVAVSIAAAVFFGLSPALESTRIDLASAIKEENGGVGRPTRFRSILIGGQVTASMALLVCASFLTRGLMRSEFADTGFDTRLLLVSGEFGDDGATAFASERRMADRIRTLPHIESVALGGFPMTGTWTPPIVVGEVRGRTLASYASAGYFATLGIPFVAGRDFDPVDSDRAPGKKDSTRHAVISEATAAKFWPGENPVGRQFTLDLNFRGTLEDFEVIGVVRDARYANLSRIDPAHVYLAGFDQGGSGIVIRASGADMRAIAASLQAKFGEAADTVDVQPFEQGPLETQRALSRALSMFAILLATLAAGLASIGIYGVTNYLVGRQRREIGIRAALGASRAGILYSAVVGNLAPVGVGLVLGSLMAGAASAAVQSTLSFPGSVDFFYGLSFYDPLTFAGSAALFLGLAAAASALPARRALKVDPMTALRYE